VLLYGIFGIKNAFENGSASAIPRIALDRIIISLIIDEVMEVTEAHGRKYF